MSSLMGAAGVFRLRGRVDGSMGRNGMGWLGGKRRFRTRCSSPSLSLFDTANAPKTRRFDWTAKHTYVPGFDFFFPLDFQVCPRVAPSPPRHVKISSSIFTLCWAGWLVMVGNG